MGDSNGSMYGKMAKAIANELHLKLSVISVAAGDPLPRSSGQHPQLWVDSLGVVKREKPDFLLLVCEWQGKLKDDNGKLKTAVEELKQHARYLILITQPPQLPTRASRESMRNGSRPPFFEDANERAARTKSNAFVKGFQGDNVIVIDIEPLFAGDDGRILFSSKDGNQFFQDGGHLSAIGADLLKADVLKVMTSRRANF
jgi:hypothetical protein